MRANLKLVEVAPDTVNRKVAPQGRPTNASLRTREYVTADEVEKLIRAASGGRWGDRDAAMVLLAYRHGLRAQEIADLEWSQVEDGSTQRYTSPGQAWPAIGSSNPRRRDADDAEAPKDNALRVHDGAWQPVHRGCDQSSDEDHRRSRWSAVPCPYAHAEARLPGMRWRMLAMTRGPSRRGWAMPTSSIPSNTRSWRPRGSRASGSEGLTKQ